MENSTSGTIIGCHGSENLRLFIVPKNVYFWLPARSKFPLCETDNQHILEYVGTHESRKNMRNSIDRLSKTNHNYTYPPNWNVYESGQAFVDLSLRFKSLYGDMKTGFYSGIITTSDLKEDGCELPIDVDLCDLLMQFHDNSIIDKKELWDNDINLGKVVKILTNAGIQGGICGLFCRSGLPNLKYTQRESLKSLKQLQKENEHVKSLFAYKPHLYECDFYEHLDNVCRLIKYYEYEFRNIHFGNKDYFFGLKDKNLELAQKLESPDVVFAIMDRLVASVKTQLNHDNTLSLLDYHTIIELSQRKKIPLETVKKYVLEEIASLGIKFETMCDQSDINLTEAINICKKYSHGKWFGKSNFEEFLRVFEIAEQLNLKDSSITEEDVETLIEVKEWKLIFEDTLSELETPNLLCEFLGWNVEDKVPDLDIGLDYAEIKVALEEGLNLCKIIDPNSCIGYNRKCNLDEEYEKILAIGKQLQFLDEDDD